MEVFFRIVSFILFLPFVGWGIYTLHLRYQRKLELSPAFEAITVAGLVLFYTFEWTLIHAGTRTNFPFFILSSLGLLISGAALYGPLVMSVASHLLVEQVMPVGRSKTSEPDYRIAEALEREGDYEGAVRAYKVVARMFPKDPTALLRIADNHMKQAQPEMAAPWFKCCIECLDVADKNLRVTNRLVELYEREFNQPDEAARVLRGYVKRFPDAPHIDSVRKRLARLEAATP